MCGKSLGRIYFVALVLHWDSCPPGSDKPQAMLCNTRSRTYSKMELYLYMKWIDRAAVQMTCIRRVYLYWNCSVCFYDSRETLFLLHIRWFIVYKCIIECYMAEDLLLLRFTTFLLIIFRNECNFIVGIALRACKGAREYREWNSGSLLCDFNLDVLFLYGPGAGWRRMRVRCIWVEGLSSRAKRNAQRWRPNSEKMDSLVLHLNLAIPVG